ncbi:alcohol dehydrogenase [Colletotrichum siamense]|uniref:alcohol dehydrogenase n=1 Tax=Colletotrichum siamense TaxID=690259 RepID=UPI001872784B|nr:alcohol dehydrogenase [Colletotrichum siamense]KAF5491805.1 alcohol dehydrogenase [Colletotrichum siamense]
MKAYHFSTPSKGLERCDVPVPTPQNNQVLVKVKACGICHTDCNIVSGIDTTFFWKRPIILGHEIAGVVVSCGADITKFKVGDAVVSVITPKHPVELGDVVDSPGIGRDGGFAEYVVLSEDRTLPIPYGVSFAQAAVATDAVATAYHAVVAEGQISPGSKVAVIGLGGLGLSAVQIAAGLGACVFCVDLDRRKFPAAALAGAHSSGTTFDSFPGVRFDVVLDFAGAGSSTSAAAKAVKLGGKVILVGLASKQAVLDTHFFVALGVKLIGSAGSSLQEVEKSLELVANNKVRPALEEVPFERLAEGVDRLLKGNVVGRLYADPSQNS